ncbi:nucleotide exchange factor Fes1-domain-containing protein, partial [Coniella lustricola]
NKNLNELLKWSIQAQTAGENTATAATTADQAGDSNNAAAAVTSPSTTQPPSQLTPEILASLLGGPSDADLMVEAMQVITSPDPTVDLETKLIAFDNFEQLIESLDNANNMPTLNLWTPLLSMLTHAETDLRRYAAWCVGTAVQNNEKSQERLLAAGGLPGLVQLATSGEEEEAVRRKAVYALSSACRNYQPAMDVVAKELAKKGALEEGKGQVDATNMDAVDEIMTGLKNK